MNNKADIMTSATFLDNSSLQLPFLPTTECLLVDDSMHLIGCDYLNRHIQFGWSKVSF